MRRRAWWTMAAALVLGVALGCSGKPGASGTGPQPSAPAEGEEEAPHGGILFATKDHKYHVEVVVDKEKPPVLYLLDNKVKNAVPTPEDKWQMTIKGTPPQKLEFVPEPQTGDPKGETSRFKGPADPKLKPDLDWDKVEISGKVKGKPYVFQPDK